MSVKAMALVWDMPCPDTINGLQFEAHHKYILIAYADHADHQGKNIYPAIETIRKKTGYKSERSIQNITHELESMQVLIADGEGPRGTRKWRIPFNDEGAKIAPPQILQGATNDKSLGAIPSGAIPSGANIAPELKEPEPEQIESIYQNMDLVWEQTKTEIKNHVKRAEYATWIEPTQAVNFDGQTLTIEAGNSYAVQWLEKNILYTAQNIAGVYLKFTTPQLEDA